MSCIKHIAVCTLLTVEYVLQLMLAMYAVFMVTTTLQNSFSLTFP